MYMHLLQPIVDARCIEEEKGYTPEESTTLPAVDDHVVLAPLPRDSVIFFDNVEVATLPEKFIRRQHCPEFAPPPRLGRPPQIDPPTRHVPPLAFVHVPRLNMARFRDQMAEMQTRVALIREHISEVPPERWQYV
jgi:hypothetical protein